MEKKFKVERDILIYAMRYSLGRMTYSGTVVIDNIKKNIDLFTINDLELLLRDIVEQESFGGYGMDCDKNTWMGFKGYLEEIIEKRESEALKPS